MPDYGTPFLYPRLPVSVDAIRILTVEAGDFLDPFVCTLTAATFGDRPRYVALSYTWGSSYPDNTKLSASLNEEKHLSQSSKTSSSRLWDRSQTPHEESGLAPLDQYQIDILSGQRVISSQNTSNDPPTLMLNGQPFDVAYNLHLALLHLRSPTHSIAIWVDAICINQADSEERNKQVSLMSFIYKRATRVVAWLGTKDYPTMAGLFRSMSFEWKAGQTQHFAAFVADASKMQLSSKPDRGTLARLRESKYWTRLWVIQEVCLPRFLIFVYGSNVWTYEDFRQWDFLPAAGQSLPQPVSDGYTMMLRLFETRDQRYTDMMRLESLIERFAKSECTELKDKVYGLLGCANDIRPFVGQNGEMETLKDDIKSFSTRLQPSSTPGRGIGSLRVDYSRSFYEIWTSVIEFVFFKAKIIEGPPYFQFGDEIQESWGHPAGITLKEERCISIVRIASIVQDALGQKIENTFGGHGPIADTTYISALGYIAGEIVQIGPDVSSLIASYRAQQDWTSCWFDHYQKAEDLEILRRIDEDYAAKMLEYEEKDINRIQDIRSSHVIAWRFAGDNNCLTDLKPSYVAEYTMTWDDVKVNEQQPHICLGTGYQIGLVPPGAKLGDVIVRFWNCDAAIVMRPIEAPMFGKVGSIFKLIGRADIAEVFDRRATPGRDDRAHQCMLNDTPPGFKKGSLRSGAVSVKLDLKTLQIITAYVTA